MKITIPYRKVFRPALIAALAAISTLAVVAQPRPGGDAGRNDNRANRHAPRPPAPPAPVMAHPRPAASPRSYVEVRLGNDRYYTHRGIFYRSGPRGYIVVRPPIGLRIPVLPIGFARIYVNNVVYYRYNNIYYRPASGGYVVVDTPAVVINRTVTAPPPVVVTTTSTPAFAPAVVETNTSDNDYQPIVIGGAEYLFKDGQFFQKTGDGLVWVEPLIGAVVQKLPPDATSVWYQDVEYFDCDSVYFRKTPDGYKVVQAPWVVTD